MNIISMEHFKMSGCYPPINNRDNFYSEIEKSIQEEKDRGSKEVDWKQIKDILCGMGDTIGMIAEKLPKGFFKNILIGVSGVLNLLCSLI